MNDNQPYDTEYDDAENIFTDPSIVEQSSAMIWRAMRGYRVHVLGRCPPRKQIVLTACWLLLLNGAKPTCTQ